MSPMPSNRAQTRIMEGRNQTPIVELILVGFGNDPELQPLLFLLFLVIYIAAVAGNLLIIVLVVADRHLHTPMYYFVANLSAVEICYVSTTLPRLIGSLATGDRTISLHNCFVQFDFYGILSTAETLLLSTMCCDRYLAICHPLRYPALMNGRVCGHMVAGCWIFSISYTVMLQTFILQFTYCGPKEFDHFFCDFASDGRFCGTTRTLILLIFIMSVIITFGIFLFTLVTYICIIITILRIPSSTGKQKAFSTCSSHLIVVAVYYVSGFTIYALSQFQLPTILYKIFSVMSTVLIPLINPLIYCLRNKEVHQALRKAGMNLVDFRHRQGV
nr:olfactory receptor 1M1-like [Pelodiscus sinensis]|eukprot:XP_006110435.2 olfactory receptor 1M1-like [Pelodiscus sinensis]